jgi:hypothetical protein
MSDEGSKKAKILRQVQALLAKADGTPFTEEADTYRQKADELMTLYAIEEFELAAAGGKPREAVESRVVPVAAAGSPIGQPLVDLASTIAAHCRCRIVYYNLRALGRVNVSAKVIGFPSDLDFFELLLVSLQMKMGMDLEPKYDTTKTKGQNVKIMKEAGMKWARICDMCDIPHDQGKSPEAISIYRKECKAQGVKPMTIMPGVYVNNFAAGFVTEIGQRLLAMRDTTEKHVASTGHDLVLFKTRDEEVQDAFREMFPKLHHVPAKRSSFNGTARAAGAKSGATADLSGGRRGTGTGNRGELGS